MVSEYYNIYRPPIHKIELYRIVKGLDFKLKEVKGKKLKTYKETDITKAFEQHEAKKKHKWNKNKI